MDSSKNRLEKMAYNSGEILSNKEDMNSNADESKVKRETETEEHGNRNTAGTEKPAKVCANSNEAKVTQQVQEVKQEKKKETSIENGEQSTNVAGHKRKASAELDSPSENKIKKQKLITKAEKMHQCYTRLTLSESLMRELDYPRPDPSGKEGCIKLYGDHFGFKKGHCKRCDKMFDCTFSSLTKCDFHMERSKRYNGRQQPHGCCGRGYGSKGCRTAPSHVYKGNLYLDLENYKVTEKKDNPEDKFTVYAVDTESIHTKKGLEVCRVTVVDRKLKVIYNEFCLPTSEVIDFNTIWSGITEKDIKDVTKTFEELREDMLKLFSADTILVGHGLSSDLISMKIVHNKVIDTLYLYPHHRGWPLKRSLKDIALTELGMRIQDGEGHDSAEDALVAMKLARRKVAPLRKQLKSTKTI